MRGMVILAVVGLMICGTAPLAPTADTSHPFLWTGQH
jgi:hypothetical protein